MVRAPEIIGGIDCSKGFSWMGDVRAPTFFRDQATAFDDIADCRTTWLWPVGLTWLKDTEFYGGRFGVGVKPPPDLPDRF